MRTDPNSINWDKIKRRVDAGEGFKPVVRSMGYCNTTARKYAKILHSEWYASAVDGYRAKMGKTISVRVKTRAYGYVAAIVLMRWIVKAAEYIQARRDGKAKQLKASRHLRVRHSPEAIEARRKKYNEIGKARYRFKYNNDNHFRARAIAKTLAHKRKHPEMNRANTHRCRLRREGRMDRQSFDSSRVISESLKMAKHICYWCKSKLPAHGWHMDHVVPICRGGAHAAYNIVKACAKCNSTKSGQDANSFIKRGQLCLL